MAEDQNNDKTQSEGFYRYFRSELIEIEDKINSLPKISTVGERSHAIEQCYAVVNKLSDEAIKASTFLAPHDRRTYGESIAGLRQQLNKTQDSINGKKKFSFKSGASRAANVAADADAGSSTVKTETEDSTSPQTTEGAPPTIPPSTSKAVDLEDHNRQHLLIPAYRDSEACSGSIVNVHRCVIDKKMANGDLKGTPLASLTLKNISESLIICGSIHGPVHLTNITDSIIVVASQQFRMHESRGCDVYLHTSSLPILEDCEGIRFAPLPDLYQVERTKGTEEHWREVADFNWHRSDQPNPNWSVLPEDDRLSEEVWRDVVPGKPLRGVEDILRPLGLVKGNFY